MQWLTEKPVDDQKLVLPKVGVCGFPKNETHTKFWLSYDFSFLVAETKVGSDEAIERKSNLSTVPSTKRGHQLPNSLVAGVRLRDVLLKA